MNESAFLKIKHEIKNELISYYDAIKSDIDIQSQELLVNSTIKEKREEILYLNELLIEKVDVLFEQNIVETDDYFSNLKDFINDEFVENIRRKAFKQYCLFVEGECLRNQLKESNPIGILIITDFYLNSSQQAFIKNYFTKESKMVDIELDNILVMLARESIKFHEYKINKSILNLYKDEMINSLNSVENFNLFFNNETYNIKILRADSFLNFDRLRYLKISSKIDKLEQNGLRHLKNLEELYIINTETEFEPNDYFSGLSRLNYICINGNKIERLNNHFFNSTSNLRELNLANCNISHIDSGSFSNLKNLEILNLSYNNIIFDKECKIFHPLVSLKILYLNYCNLENIDQSMFKNLKYLKFLSLSANNLSILEEKIFSDLNNLDELILSNCKIKEIRNSAFEGLNNLRVLDLLKNDIETLEINTFKGLYNLNELILYNNQIKCLKANVFDFLVNLKIIKLVQNKLELIENDVFNNLTNLNTLHIDSKFIKQIEINENVNIVKYSSTFL